MNSQEVKSLIGDFKAALQQPENAKFTGSLKANIRSLETLQRESSIPQEETLCVHHEVCGNLALRSSPDQLCKECDDEASLCLESDRRQGG